MDKLELIKRNTTEILTIPDLKKLLKEKKQIVAYWGAAPTGPVHLGYIASLSKLFDFIEAGIRVKILIADVHAALDDLKSPWEDIDKRAKYYKKCIELALPWKEKPEIILGSDFQLKSKYQSDVLKLATVTTLKRATRATSTVCRMKDAKVSSIIYPLMQTLDEEYLKVDIQLAGEDHRYMLAFAREALPKLSYNRRVEVMTPLVIGLGGPGVKMSASIPSSHIKLYESEDSIRQKISASYCPAGDVKDNPVIQLYKFIVFPIKNKLIIKRPAKFGGDIKFNSFEELEKAFKAKNVHPLDLKNALADEIIDIFAPVREYFKRHKSELEEIGPNFL